MHLGGEGQHSVQPLLKEGVVFIHDPTAENDALGQHQVDDSPDRDGKGFCDPVDNRRRRRVSLRGGREDCACVGQTNCLSGSTDCRSGSDGLQASRRAAVARRPAGADRDVPQLRVLTGSSAEDLPSAEYTSADTGPECQHYDGIVAATRSKATFAKERGIGVVLKPDSGLEVIRELLDDGRLLPAWECVGVVKGATNRIDGAGTADSDSVQLAESPARLIHYMLDGPNDLCAACRKSCPTVGGESGLGNDAAFAGNGSDGNLGASDINAHGAVHGLRHTGPTSGRRRESSERSGFPWWQRRQTCRR